jgi:RNA polymerase sigma-70 factor (ECF subfamily)
MPGKSEAVNTALEEYRAYLETLTFIQIDPRLQAQVRQSDIVQDTLVEAWLELNSLQALDDVARRRRLRRMLINNLLDKVREVTAAYHDPRLERSLEESAYRLKSQLIAEDRSPIELVEEEEEKELLRERLLKALAQLPERERQALILQKYHDCTLAEIAEHLGCTAGAVAGLQKRGLERLRQLVPEME